MKEPNPIRQTSLPDSILWHHVEVFVQKQNPGFILASPLLNDPRSRFQFAGIFPEKMIRVFPGYLEILTSDNESRSVPAGKNILFEIEKEVNLIQNGLSDQPLGSGGWFFTFSYEFSGLENEPLATPPANSLLAVGFKPGVFFRHDLKSNKISLLADTKFDSDGLIELLLNQQESIQTNLVSLNPKLTENFRTYRSNVESIRDHIKNGDTYEVNYAHQLTGQIENGTPDQVWNSLVADSPSSFFTWFKLDDFTLISSSPERFFKTSLNQITVQPMKGTRRRDSNAENDRLLKEELIRSEKDQAENLMIVDLMRNDLGKICETGSVKVTSLFEVESYQTVHQMISTITGKLPGSISIFKIIEALFPPGSMTGAPKKRTMELIRKYETARRGFYSGISGYFDEKGNSEWSVLIRCIEFNDLAFTAKAGGAITSDSTAEQEYAETITKLRGILKSLNISPDSIQNLESGLIKDGF